MKPFSFSQAHYPPGHGVFSAAMELEYHGDNYGLHHLVVEPGSL